MNISAVILENAWVQLAPIEEAHREGLRAAARDPSIWAHWPRDVVGDGWDKTFDRQLGEHADGSWMLFTVMDRFGPRAPSPQRAADTTPTVQEIVGQTCYLAIAPEHDRVEVGGTWYAPTAQASHVNPACKLLMLGHGFACGAERVELKTDALNMRSRNAMAKMGATFEGIHRSHMRRRDGTRRDTAWYSVIRAEWPAVKEGLEARLAGGRNG
ncbi:MAG: N-acetyltransferase [Alphaproteobacteria bacterium]|nr:N-acetyltransferase [Alphaproteobacteria bacterium]